MRFGDCDNSATVGSSILLREVGGALSREPGMGLAPVENDCRLPLLEGAGRVAGGGFIVKLGVPKLPS